ncbi:hypothetical protein HBI56_100940 [Parastagonospora nodorum]|uniref:Uncharacterized protein n=1 Tax=Phaeosphaeria nodorum (strain SN15 / ATCC MYA-4574 / FGSC 10173) TaxID=321614 RepID=A0A7U2F6F5_PHANO|nr:hypothetical protein HBH56_029860 [Parastagonospora nodorum]QRC99232.1 hypothetical protein JI435_413150 [Parastagonospora nodorum SN15]KAH3934418.1 hypothetical protein HBH54_052150 [Parastagonospora nodorum]KAH3943018.1 hypothetical protein HBH53_178550 [Parastagonospora nodorum]KAH3959270.1 hypothetical protein HBH51_200910 [Parastagonospora nodorum]
MLAKATHEMKHTLFRNHGVQGSWHEARQKFWKIKSKYGCNGPSISSQRQPSFCSGVASYDADYSCRKRKIALEGVSELPEVGRLSGLWPNLKHALQENNPC